MKIIAILLIFLSAWIKDNTTTTVILIISGATIFIIDQAIEERKRTCRSSNFRKFNDLRNITIPK